MKTSEIYDTMKSHWADFEENHNIYVEKQNKAAAGRARKAINELKKIITNYKKTSVEEGKK